MRLQKALDDIAKTDIGYPTILRYAICCLIEHYVAGSRAKRKKLLEIVSSLQKVLETYDNAYALMRAKTAKTTYPLAPAALTDILFCLRSCRPFMSSSTRLVQEKSVDNREFELLKREVNFLEHYVESFASSTSTTAQPKTFFEKSTNNIIRIENALCDIYSAVDALSRIQKYYASISDVADIAAINCVMQLYTNLYSDIDSLVQTTNALIRMFHNIVAAKCPFLVQMNLLSGANYSDKDMRFEPYFLAYSELYLNVMAKEHTNSKHKRQVLDAVVESITTMSVLLGKDVIDAKEFIQCSFA